MEEDEIIAALDEFLQLLPKPREQWLDYSSRQKEFKQILHPGHLDLYYISGVPCEIYLKEEFNAEVALVRPKAQVDTEKIA